MQPQPTILVVDDLPDWRKTLCGLLMDEGYNVQTASSSSEALTYCSQKYFDLAILDICLDASNEHNLDGIKLAQVIRNVHPSINIIFITGLETLESAEQSFCLASHGRRFTTNYVTKMNALQIIGQ